MQSFPWKQVIAGALGGTAGIAYYLLIGCESG
jgi:hypothetical protein